MYIVEVVTSSPPSDVVTQHKLQQHKQQQQHKHKQGSSETTTRGFTSVNLTLRQPTTEPQAPIDVSSQDSSSPLDPRSFQSRLDVKIGHGKTADVAAARIKSPPESQQSSNLLQDSGMDNALSGTLQSFFSKSAIANKLETLIYFISRQLAFALPSVLDKIVLAFHR
jgi:hypothetical protein